MSAIRLSRGVLLFGLVALGMSFVITRGIVNAPLHTDAFYHYVVAERVVRGDGLTVPFVWPYTGAPEVWPDSGETPSHTYWMPLTTLSAAFGMWIMGEPGEFWAAQLPFTLMLAATAGVGYWMGGRLGGTNRHRWTVGLLVLFSGFFTRWWGTIDTFAPYAITGALALVFTGLALDSEKPRYQLWFLAGIFAGLGHLTRADGMLLGIVAVMVLLWPSDFRSGARLQHRLLAIVPLAIGYLLVMAAWFARNLDAVGSPLAVGGTASIWFTTYNDLFSYPMDIGPNHLFADGWGAFIESRWIAFTNNLGTFIAVEGLVVMAPLMLIGLWNRRQSRFLRAFWLYALGLHLAMTFVFPFPGFRGGLFHSAAALVPFWAALGIVGLDDTVDWIAKRRRTWNPRTAKVVYTGGLLVLAVALSWTFGLNRVDFERRDPVPPRTYRVLQDVLPHDVRVMVNDPAALYHYTGMGGAVLVNEDIAMVQEIARVYKIDYLMVNVRESDDAINVPEPMVFDIDDPPAFLESIPVDHSGVRLYAIDPG